MKLKLTVVSPVHIGSQMGDRSQTLVPKHEFIYRQNRCYVIDQDKLIEALQNKGLIDSFLCSVDKIKSESERFSFNLDSFLNDYFSKGLSDNEICDFLNSISAYSTLCPYPDVAKTKQYRPFIRDAYARPYIPGTAIKGAIRTAVLFCFVKERLEDKEFKEGLVKKVEDTLKKERLSVKKKKQIIGEFLTPEVFQDFRLGGMEKEAHTDLLRALEIQDVEPLDKDSLEVKEVKIINRTGLKKWNYLGGFSIYPECLLPVSFEVKIRFKMEILEDFPKEGLKDFLLSKVSTESDLEERLIEVLIALCDQWARWQINSEQNFYGKLQGVDEIKRFYQTKNPNLRLGWGGGMLGKTIFDLLPHDLKKEVAGLFYQNFPGFPKTRRVIVEVEKGQPSSPLGWVRLDLI
jgi:CRISPR type III-A-associated RAMP protein Csm5